MHYETDDKWNVALQPFRPLNQPIAVGNANIGDGSLTIIAGPCAIESEDLCLYVAEYLSNLCGELGIKYIFKSSFDKANRTAITSFRGHGLDSGLNILKSVRERIGVPVLTDVHETDQVQAVAQVADILQIPAFLSRQTDLLVECGKWAQTVNIKKGQFLHADDMTYAASKVTSTGNTNILLTERGALFGYRDLVVDMRNLILMRSQGFPTVYDATHSVQQMGGRGGSSGGLTEFIPAQVRAAVAVGVDALFIETHPNPDQALSDGSTMVPLSHIKNLIEMALLVHSTHSKGTM